MALEHNHHNQITCEDPQFVPTLLTEIVFEILLRLPVDSLLRFRSVCKSWCSLISDPHFIKSHLRLSTSNNHYAHHRLMFKEEIPQGFSFWPNIDYKTCNPYDMLHDNSIKVLDLDYPFKRRGKSVSIVGSCNGLLCMTREDDGLFIWNPSTRKLNKLPDCDHEKQLNCFMQYGFGYDEYTDDYKVVEFRFNIEFSCNFKGNAKVETFVQIYSLKLGSWKKLDAFPYLLLDYGKFSNGALHWAAKGSASLWTIVSLDLAKETCGEVLQPVYDEGDKESTLGSLREGLCVLCNYKGIRVDLWVMKVYGVRDSWTKLVSIPYLTDPGCDNYSVPLCISDDGKFLLQFRSKLIVYDSKNSSFSEVRNIYQHFKPCTFVESLVSPDAPADLGDRFGLICMDHVDYEG